MNESIASERQKSPSAVDLHAQLQTAAARFDSTSFLPILIIKARRKIIEAGSTNPNALLGAQRFVERMSQLTTTPESLQALSETINQAEGITNSPRRLPLKGDTVNFGDNRPPLIVIDILPPDTNEDALFQQTEEGLVFLLERIFGTTN